MRLVLLGPPGSGKGTQAAVLAEELGIPAISTGEIVRAQIAAATEAGRQAEVYSSAGELVPDELTVAMLATRLAEADCRGGYLLDGFPRTLGQAERLHDHLAAAGLSLDGVLELVVDEDEVVRRLGARRVQVDGAWVTRDDDRPDTVLRRMQVYRELTAPLSDFYAAAGLLRRVDAHGEVAEVTARLRAALPPAAAPGGSGG
ncbi:adenylate kinase [Petropleomorpha daqingensis]|uniref:Adenylate kinase n=1 Tax=Petropleomorpha daqingensis TaxID=2026353 RepID=A0A853CMP3_9ACTN|nr:adenylate kinase [Petropleomorpha daqingensis]NYJ07263.1 adenylate kinase [Petropleomorpha daqingensis]